MTPPSWGVGICCTFRVIGCTFHIICRTLSITCSTFHIECGTLQNIYCIFSVMWYTCHRIY